jgi:hypothetical protein
VRGGGIQQKRVLVRHKSGCGTLSGSPSLSFFTFKMVQYFRAHTIVRLSKKSKATRTAGSQSQICGAEAKVLSFSLVCVFVWCPAPPGSCVPTPPGCMSSALSQRKGGLRLSHGSTSWGSLVIWTGPDEASSTEKCSCSVLVRLHYLLIGLPRCAQCLCTGPWCRQGNTYVLLKLALIFVGESYE